MMYDLRPYQTESIHGSAKWPGIIKAWQTDRATLLVLPTGCGKTIVFAALTRIMVAQGRRVLILAHRDELIRQAADKIMQSTGLACAVEKADECAAGCLEMITVASVQTLLNPERRDAIWAPDVIIVDEAHHALSESYQSVLGHWPDAKVLGVTATPDRGDMRNLGQFFDSLAYEYTLPQAIAAGYLSKIKALTCPLHIDLAGVKQQAGDFQASGLGSALEPYMDQIAAELVKNCTGRKTLCFLPLIDTSEKFSAVLNRAGLRTREVNGQSDDRKQALEEFKAGRWDVLCNAMLLTEGYDEPSIDCVVVLRPTKIRSLYAQMVGRGTRLHPGKEHLLLLDFLWHTERHALCHPANLIAEDPDVAAAMTAAAEASAGAEMDVDDEALEAAKADVIKAREEALAKKLAEMRHKKRALVDPLQYAMSIGDADLVDYSPALNSEVKPVLQAQLDALEKAGIYPSDVTTQGHAQAIMDRIQGRKAAGMATPKQVRLLERYGWKQAGQMTHDAAQKVITRIAANGWRVPHGLTQEAAK